MKWLKQLFCKHEYIRIEIKNTEQPYVSWYCPKCKTSKIER